MGFLPLEFEELNQTLPADFKEQGNDMLAEFEEPGQDPQVEFEEPVQIIPVGFEELGEAMPVEFDVAYVSGQRKPATVKIKSKYLNAFPKEKAGIYYRASGEAKKVELNNVTKNPTLDGLCVGDSFLIFMSDTTDVIGRTRVTAEGADVYECLFQRDYVTQTLDGTVNSFRDQTAYLVTVTSETAEVYVEFKDRN